MRLQTFALMKFKTQVCLYAVLLSAIGLSTPALAQSSKINSNNEGRSTEVKSFNTTKSDVNERTYVANADNCSAKALHPPLDHGPKASTSSWLNSQRVAECYGRVR